MDITIDSIEDASPIPSRRTPSSGRLDMSGNASQRPILAIGQTVLNTLRASLPSAYDALIATDVLLQNSQLALQTKENDLAKCIEAGEDVLRQLLQIQSRCRAQDEDREQGAEKFRKAQHRILELESQVEQLQKELSISNSRVKVLTEQAASSFLDPTAANAIAKVEVLQTELDLLLNRVAEAEERAEREAALAKSGEAAVAILQRDEEQLRSELSAVTTQMKLAQDQRDRLRDSESEMNAELSRCYQVVGGIQAKRSALLRQFKVLHSSELREEFLLADRVTVPTNAKELATALREIDNHYNLQQLILSKWRESLSEEKPKGGQRSASSSRLTGNTSGTAPKARQPSPEKQRPVESLEDLTAAADRTASPSPVTGGSVIGTLAQRNREPSAQTIRSAEQAEKESLRRTLQQSQEKCRVLEKRIFELESEQKQDELKRLRYVKHEELAELKFQIMTADETVKTLRAENKLLKSAILQLGADPEKYFFSSSAPAPSLTSQPAVAKNAEQLSASPSVVAPASAPVLPVGKGETVSPLVVDELRKTIASQRQTLSDQSEALNQKQQELLELLSAVEEYQQKVEQLEFALERSTENEQQLKSVVESQRQLLTVATESNGRDAHQQGSQSIRKSQTRGVQSPKSNDYLQQQPKLTTPQRLAAAADGYHEGFNSPLPQWRGAGVSPGVPQATPYLRAESVDQMVPPPILAARIVQEGHGHQLNSPHTKVPPAVHSEFSAADALAAAQTEAEMIAVKEENTLLREALQRHQQETDELRQAVNEAISESLSPKATLSKRHYLPASLIDPTHVNEIYKAQVAKQAKVIELAEIENATLTSKVHELERELINARTQSNADSAKVKSIQTQLEQWHHTHDDDLRHERERAEESAKKRAAVREVEIEREKRILENQVADAEKRWQDAEVAITTLKAHFQDYKTKHPLPVAAQRELEKDVERLRDELAQARRDAISMQLLVDEKESQALSAQEKTGQLISVAQRIHQHLGDALSEVESLISHCQTTNKLESAKLCEYFVDLLTLLREPLLSMAPVSEQSPANSAALQARGKRKQTVRLNEVVEFIGKAEDVVLGLKEELHKKDGEVADMKNQVRTIQHQLQAEQRRNESLQVTIQQLESLRERLQDETKKSFSMYHNEREKEHEKEIQLAKLQSEMNVLRRDKDALGEELNVTNDRLRALQDERVGFTHKLVEVERRHANALAEAEVAVERSAKEKELLANELGALRTNLDAVGVQFQGAQQAWNSERTALKTEIGRLTVEVSSLEDQVRSLQKDLAGTRALLEEAEMVMDEVNQTEEFDAHNQGRFHELEGHLAERELDCERLQREKVELQRELKTAQTQLETLKARMDNDRQHMRSFHDLSTANVQSEQAVSALKKQLETVVVESAQLKAQLEAAQSEKLWFKSQLDIAIAEKKQIQRSHETDMEDLKARKDQVEQLERRLAQLERDREPLKLKLREVLANQNNSSFLNASFAPMGQSLTAVPPQSANSSGDR